MTLVLFRGASGESGESMTIDYLRRIVRRWATPYGWILRRRLAALVRGRRRILAG